VTFFLAEPLGRRGMRAEVIQVTVEDRYLVLLMRASTGRHDHAKAMLYELVAGHPRRPTRLAKRQPSLVRTSSSS
jgi:hypothetical protein